MNRFFDKLHWLLPAFVAGAIVGGLGGWKIAGIGGSGIEGANPGGASRSADRALPSVRLARDGSGFAPSGDPSADFHRIQRMRDSASRVQAFRDLLDSMSPEEVVVLMKELRRFAKDQEQEDQAGGVVALMASQHLVVEHAALTDPAAVLSALAAAGGAMSDSDFYKDVLRLWARRDPEAACRYFSQHTMSEIPASAKSIAGILARELVKTDPEGTFRWLRGLKADYVDDVAHDALQTLSHYDGVTAGRLLAQNGDLKNAPEFVEAMTAGWARSEPEKALEWVLNLPANIAGEGIRTAAGFLAEKDFDLAMATVENLPGDQRAAAICGMVDAVGEKHVQEFLTKVEALPECPARARAVDSLVSSWLDQSPEEASAWVSRLPEGASRDKGSFMVALKTFESDPRSALDWVSSIGNPDDRRKGLDGFVGEWLSKDPKAARAWVLGSGRISEDERNRLLEKTGR